MEVEDWLPRGTRSLEHPAAPYLEAVVAYATRGSTRFHVPGHKGGAGADPGLRAAIGWPALGADIPQDIEGIDLGPEPTPFQRAEQLAAEAHGAERSWFLTNGATQGNHALCLALAPLGAPVVVQRNSHASVIDGLVLSGGTPTFVAPEYEHELGMAHGVTPESLAAALERAPDALARTVRLMRSTSPSALLMASLDGARRQLALHGEALLNDTILASRRAREAIAAVEGAAVIGEEFVGRPGVAGWDPLRVGIHGRRTRCTGQRVAAGLREAFDIHVELATHATMVLILGLGQPPADLERLAHDFAAVVGENRGRGGGAAPRRGAG